MQESTIEQVYKKLKDFTEKSIKSFDLDNLKRAYPFHSLFFDDEGLTAFKQERSIVTKMGKTLYPDLAEIIAKEKFQDVKKEHTFLGKLDTATIAAIDNIVSCLRSKDKDSIRVPNHSEELEEIFNVELTGELRPVKVIADLYIGDFKGSPCFFEIKSPLPNLDVCAQTKLKILKFIALMQDQNPKAFLAFPYNPFLSRADYKHGFTKQIIDLDKEVLMGKEFWDAVGGEGTYEQILEIIERVRTDLGR